MVVAQNQKIDRDCLTGVEIRPEKCSIIMDPFDGIIYFSDPIGNVKLTSNAYFALSNQQDKTVNLKIAGILRYLNEKDEIIIISEGIIESIIKKYESTIPDSFEAKRKKIIEYLISKGGKEYNTVDIYREIDFTLIYSSQDELDRVIRSLREDNYISVQDLSKSGWHGVLPTKDGIKFYEEGDSGAVNLSDCFSALEKKQIYNLITEDSIEEVLFLISDKLAKIDHKIGIKTVLEMQGEYASFKQDHIRGILQYDDASRVKAKMRSNIINLFE